MMHGHTYIKYINNLCTTFHVQY